MFQTPSERAVRRCWNMLPDDPTGNYVSNPFRAGGEALRTVCRRFRRCPYAVSNPFRAGGEALSSGWQSPTTS